MSENAHRAYRNGLFTLSKVNATLLNRNNFKYSVNFFKWLCSNGYIAPNETHHVSASVRLVPFYAPKAINYANTYLNLPNLYKIYLGKETMESLIEQLEVCYARVTLSSRYFGYQGAPLQLDCIQHCENLWWSENQMFVEDQSSCLILDSYECLPTKWDNRNTEGILKQLVSRYWSKLIRPQRIGYRGL